MQDITQMPKSVSHCYINIQCHIDLGLENSPSFHMCTVLFIHLLQQYGSFLWNESQFISREFSVMHLQTLTSVFFPNVS